VQNCCRLAELPTAERVLNTPESPYADDASTFVDELDEDFSVDDGHFYDEILEDV
jgi:hypothetical protein